MYVYVCVCVCVCVCIHTILRFLIRKRQLPYMLENLIYK